MLTGLIGTGGAILLAGIALLIAKFRHHLPGGPSDEIALTVSIGLMALAGALATYIGIGRFAVSVIRGVRGFIGPAGPEVLTLVGSFTLLVVIVAICRRASEKVMWIAFSLPLLSAAINRGIFLDLNNALIPLAQQTQAMIAAKLGA
jgi:hypothetical protein